jgi:hypothetical protein
MGIDAPNLQGANLRQVLVTGEQAAQLQANMHRDGGEFQSRLGMAMVEKALRTRDQSDATDMVVKRQEDQAQFSSGDSLHGGGGGGAGTGESRSSRDEDSLFEDSDSRSSLDTLDAPFELADQFRASLLEGGRKIGDQAFRAIDRRFLAGLQDRPNLMDIDTPKIEDLPPVLPEGPG